MNTDNAPAEVVLGELSRCASGWESKARIIGNVRAGDIVRACEELAAVRQRMEKMQSDCAALIAAEAERDTLRAELAALEKTNEENFMAAQRECGERLVVEAERDKLRELLREARDALLPRAFPREPDLLDRIDALVNGGGDE